MKQAACILSLLFFSFAVFGQEIPPTTEQQFENLTDVDQNETEDDSYLQQLAHFKKHPLNLNEADAADLKELIFLNAFQIEKFIAYRKQLGKLISIYELQAIPGWDVQTIRRILPYVYVGNVQTLKDDLLKRFKSGDQSLLLRLSQVLEQSKGFDDKTTGTKYLGSPQKIFLRYRYQYKNLLRFGFAADKDAGEPFFKNKQKLGFDFYSFHFFARQLGKVTALALGDFTVNMGQGLIQWQSLAFKKSSDILSIKRQSAILRPYNSGGEFYFHRGVGATVQLGKFESTVYCSYKKISANFVADTVNNKDFVSSLLNSGYHRTASELDDRSNVTQLSAGGNVSYSYGNLHMGLNAVYYHFSLPVQKRDEPYNFFAISGSSWSNYSVDYSYTFRNLHFFGELGADKNLNKAITNGLLISVDPAVDLSFLHRAISKSYQAVYGNAFTESTYPANENGLYAGITLRPLAGIRVDAYADVFKFPFLRYLVDAPSSGKDFLAQITYTPNKQLEIYTRFRSESKQANQSDNITVTNFLVALPKQNWRLQWLYKITAAVAVRSRAEALWYDRKGENKETGFLVFSDVIYKPLLAKYSGNIRLQYFETGGYNCRIYAYENDVLYAYSIPAFFDKGFRYYINLNYDLRRNLSAWLKFSQTIYPEKNSIGSGLDEISGHKKSEIKFQFIWEF